MEYKEKRYSIIHLYARLAWASISVIVCAHALVNVTGLLVWYFTGFRDLAAFGRCLGKDAACVEEVWDSVYGKFDKAVLHLVVDVLRETKNAGESIEESLSSALMKMEDTDSALYAAKAIEKGFFSYTKLM